MSIQFQSLFTVQVLHDYYNRDDHQKQCADFEIVPTEDCTTLMKNMKVLHKNYNNKLFIVISATKEVNNTPPPAFNFSPFIKLPGGIVFRYYLKLKNSYFSNFTAIGLQLSGKKRFYFSNLSQNESATILSLSGSIGLFTAGKKYICGDIVKDITNNVFEAVRNSDGTAQSNDLTNTDYWQQANTPDLYVNNTDQVILTGDNYLYTLQTPVNTITIRVFSIDKTDVSLPYNNLVDTIVKTFSQNQQTINIDLSKRAPGKYKVVVNSEPDLWLYVDQAALFQNVFGIIEIHHFEKVPAHFQLLSLTGNIKVPEPVFTILFKNRSVTWKYISQNAGDAIEVIDTAINPLAFVPASGQIVKSQKAIALTEKPRDSLKARRSATGREIAKLKNPEIEQLVFEQDGDTGFFASNMFIKIDT